MRVSKVELATVILLVVVTAASYSFIAPLLQGVTAERDWTYWTMNANTYTRIRDVVPVEIIVEALMASTIVYFLCYRRRQLWLWLATHPIPGRLTQTWLARIIEGYLTDDYKLQRDALRHIPRGTKQVLDVGCGGAAYLSKLTYAYKIGLDASPKRLQVARKHCNETVLHNVTEGLEDIEADAALCFEVIEHLTDEQGIQLLKDLEKFPVVILTTPREWFEVQRDGRERHLSFWPPEKLLQYGYELVGSGRIPPSNTYVRRQT